jgi:hypothetical protein
MKIMKLQGSVGFRDIMGEKKIPISNKTTYCLKSTNTNTIKIHLKKEVLMFKFSGLICYWVLLILIQGCGGGGKSSEQISIVFEDKAVDSITLDNGSSVSFIKDMLSKFIPQAHAGGKNITCNRGQLVSLKVRVFGNKDLNVSTLCDEDLELRIRRSLLRSMDRKKLIRIVSGANVGEDYFLDFSASFEFDKRYMVLEFHDPGEDPCNQDYIFNEEKGTINMVSTADPSDRAGCSDSDEEFVLKTDFRFKDGFLETDDTGLKRFDITLCAKRDNDGNIVDTKNEAVQQVGEPVGSITCMPLPEEYETSFEKWCIAEDNGEAYTGIGACI